MLVLRGIFELSRLPPEFSFSSSTSPVWLVVQQLSNIVLEKMIIILRSFFMSLNINKVFCPDLCTTK